MAEAGPGRTVHLDSLTGMRFFAALAVVLIHIGGQFARAPWLLTTESFGYIGVSFFFLLSGFVLTWSSAHQPAGRFWWLRLSRIWPATTVMAIVAFTVVAAYERVPSSLGKLSELVLLQAWWPNQTAYYGGNGVSWSLADEMFFYLLFPLVIVMLRRLSGRGLLVTAIVTLVILYILPGIATVEGMSANTYAYVFFVFPPYRFGEFLLGMLLARAVQLGVRIPAPAFVWGFGALGLGGVICGLTAYTRSVGIGVQRPYVALWVLPCFALMLAAGASRDVRTGRWWLGSRPMLRLGEWSFALYLVHKPVFLLTNPWGWWGMPRGLKSLEAFIVYISLAVAVAAALHYLIEKPIEHALRRLPVGRRRRVEAPAAASGPAAAPGPAAASAAAARRVTAPRVPDEKPDERGNGAGGRPMVTQSDTTSDLRFPR